LKIGEFGVFPYTKGKKLIFFLIRMAIEKVHILPTDKSPEFLLNSDGYIKIKGRGLILNESKIPDQIMNWTDSYLKNPAKTTLVIIAFEYLNSFSTIILVSLLKKLSQVTDQGKKLVIHWYYEADDFDLLERGEYVLSAIKNPIEFIITDNIKRG
jgi:hypothetical protein